MVIVAILLLVLAAGLGGYMLTFVLASRHPPKSVVFGHGTAAVLGVVFLLVYALTTEDLEKPWESLVIFGLAAVGGLYLFSRDMRQKEIPKWFAVVHGSLAVTALVWLLILVMN